MLSRVSKEILHLEPSAEMPDLSPAEGLASCLDAMSQLSRKLEAAVLDRLRLMRRRRMTAEQNEEANKSFGSPEISEMLLCIQQQGVPTTMGLYLVDSLFLQGLEGAEQAESGPASPDVSSGSRWAEGTQAREIIEALQRELRVEDPLIGGMARWGGQTVALKGVLGVAAVAGAGAVAAPVLAVTGALWWTYDILNMNMGSSYGIVMQAIVTIISFRLILALQSINVDEYVHTALPSFAAAPAPEPDLEGNAEGVEMPLAEGERRGSTEAARTPFSGGRSDGAIDEVCE